MSLASTLCESASTEQVTCSSYMYDGEGDVVYIMINFKCM